VRRKGSFTPRADGNGPVVVEQIEASPGYRPTVRELLYQTEWWQPQRGPLIRVAAMTDTHRLHTAAWLFKRAAMLADAEATSMMFGPFAPSGDAACDDVDALVDGLYARPEEWLREAPLFGALLAELPTPAQPDAWSDLLARAKHWSTCPRNRVLAAPVCTCTPLTDTLDAAARLALPRGTT
jgi:hypothetical protein